MGLTTTQTTMTQELQELIDLPRHWMRETHNNELPYALELQEALARCNLTAEVPDVDSFTAFMANKTMGQPGYSYGELKECWQACEKRMQRKIDDLENWKRQDLELKSQLDAQRLAKLLGAKLGESCHAAINREVPKLVEEAQSLRAQLEHMTNERNRLRDEKWDGVAKLEREVASLRAELETLRWRDVSVRPMMVDADNEGYMTAIDQNGAMYVQDIRTWPDWIQGITHWRPAALPKLPDPFTAWKSSYMPNSSDDLAREAWEKAKGE
jgi:hypothetical protein